MYIEHLRPEDADTINMAAMMGVPELDHQLKRLGLSGGSDTLEAAARMRPVVMAMAGAVRSGEDPAEAAVTLWKEVSLFAACEAGYPGILPSVQALAVALAASYNSDPRTKVEDARYEYAPEELTAEAAGLHEILGGEADGCHDGR